MQRQASIEAIGTVYRQSYPRFLRFAIAVTGSEDYARDAVQEGFARAIRRRAQFRAEGSLEAWLWRTVLNACRDECRRRTDVKMSDQSFSTNGHPDEWHELRSAIAALPERQRLAIFLRHYADLDYAAIADTLGVRRGTVAATLNAAHNALRNALSEVVP
jgi:RNA polymerase sigma-70 factor, ECF subfamily